MRMRLRLDVAYDGTDFHGWAAQPGLRTVQGEIESALAVLLRTDRPGRNASRTAAPHGGAAAPAKGEPRPRLTVGGRTDAGVHARGQVAHLDIDESDGSGRASRITARRLGGVLKRTAPDVVIHDVIEAPAAFDARFGAISRRYEYRLRGADSPRDPLTARFTAEVPRALDLAAMQRASDELLGFQDFTTFCKAREGATAIRELLRFDWRETEDGALAATIEADAFCHSMVRALVGAVVAVGSERIDRKQLIELRDRRERTSRFAVMPAHGLSLEEIVYPPDAELAARAEQTRARRESPDVLE